MLSPPFLGWDPGWILEKDARSPTAGVLATVEVISGIDTGLKFVAVQDEMGDFPPAYILRGVAGPVTIAASAVGYVTQTIALDVQGDMRQDIVMAPARDLSGTLAALPANTGQ